MLLAGTQSDGSPGSPGPPGESSRSAIGPSWWSGTTELWSVLSWVAGPTQAGLLCECSCVVGCVALGSTIGSLARVSLGRPVGHVKPSVRHGARPARLLCGVEQHFEGRIWCFFSDETRRVSGSGPDLDRSPHSASSHQGTYSVRQHHPGSSWHSPPARINSVIAAKVDCLIGGGGAGHSLSCPPWLAVEPRSLLTVISSRG